LSIAEHFELAGDNRSFMLDGPAATALAAERIAEFTIKGVPATPADALSGGNQQRLLMAMAPDNTSLLLMEHPTRGLDLGSAEWVWERMLIAVRWHRHRLRLGGPRGAASLQRSDAVFYEGRILAVVPAAQATAASLGLHRRSRAHGAGCARCRWRSWSGSVPRSCWWSLVGAPPFKAMGVIFDGAFGNEVRVAATLMAWILLVLAAAGPPHHVPGGLWNIGGGQIAMGRSVRPG
jgi:hypothetical protein